MDTTQVDESWTSRDAFVAPAARGLVPFEDVRAALLERTKPMPTLVLAASEALGYTVTADIKAVADVPGFANSSVDGYGVRCTEVTDLTQEFEVSSEIPAGVTPDVSITTGTVVRIFTGAAIPYGVDAVIMQENATEALHGSVRVVIFSRLPTNGENIRGASSDIAQGQVGIQAQTVLRSADLGVLASMGVTEIDVFAKPRVGVLATGSEVFAASTINLERGAIRDSATPTLLAAIESAGATPIDLGHIDDDRDALLKKLRYAITDGLCDVIVTVGGVSVGTYDYVPDVFSELCVGDAQSVRVAMKPGKPFAYGFAGEVTLIGLPGNPVSALVSFLCFALPVIACKAGRGDAHELPIAQYGEAASDIGRTPDSKLHFVRVKRTGSSDTGVPQYKAVNGQHSNQLHAAASADALALVCDGDGVVAGSPLRIWLLP